MVSRTSSATCAMPKSMTHRVAVEQQHVARLEVAVDDAGRVDGLERLGQPRPEPAAASSPRHRAVLVDHVVERRPGHVAGHEVGPVAVDVGVEDRGDARVVGPGPGSCTSRASRARASGSWATCARSTLIATARPCGSSAEVDDAHAALAELLDQAVGPEPVAPARGRVVDPDRRRPLGRPPVRHAPHGKPWRLGRSRSTATAGCSRPAGHARPAARRSGA